MPRKDRILFFVQFALSAFVSQFQESHIQALHNFFGKTVTAPPDPKVPVHLCISGQIVAMDCCNQRLEAATISEILHLFGQGNLFGQEKVREF